jgi:hypothetical protein
LPAFGVSVISEPETEALPRTAKSDWLKATKLWHLPDDVVVVETASDEAGSPELKVARTTKEYDVCGVRPATSHEVAGGVAVQVKPPGVDVTV